ncbi:mobilization protein MobC [Salmonella enterica]
MAAKTFYTLEQIELAKIKLEELPDLSKNKIAGKDALESMKAQVVTLATQKGYSAKEIKSALEVCEIVVSERAIRDLLSSSSASKKKTTGKTKKVVSQQEDKSQG